LGVKLEEIPVRGIVRLKRTLAFYCENGERRWTPPVTPVVKIDEEEYKQLLKR